MQHFLHLCILPPSFAELDLDTVLRNPWQTSQGKAVLSLTSVTQLGSPGNILLMYLLLNTGHGAEGLQDLDDNHHLGKAVPRAPDEVHNYTLVLIGRASHFRTKHLE